MATRSAEIRSRLKHPVVDADGHHIEFVPVVLAHLDEYLARVAGHDIARRFRESKRRVQADSRELFAARSREDIRDTWTTAPAWGTFNLSTLDRATAALPRLLSERLADMGLDFSVLFPTEALSLLGNDVLTSLGDTLPLAELRPMLYRALNTFYAEYFRGYSRHLTPAAVIPMDTPDMAVRELEHAVRTLGLKAIMISHVIRPIPRVERERPDLARFSQRVDTFGIDSDHDYDPFWARCVELGVAPTSHGPGIGWGARRSISSYMYNHIGNFAASGEALCKSIFLGGVTRRFPTLRIGFLEGGVAWACSLYSSLVEHWEKRFSPGVGAPLDLEAFGRLIEQYGDAGVKSRRTEILAYLGEHAPAYGSRSPRPRDDYAACEIRRAEDIRDLFVPNFFFGCEADDPMNACAFDKRLNRFKVNLGAMLSSDLGHWDLPDMSRVLKEAYELVEDGLLTEENFRDFAFANSVRMWGGMNPDFFKGTTVEKEAAAVLAAGAKAA